MSKVLAKKFARALIRHSAKIQRLNSGNYGHTCVVCNASAERGKEIEHEYSCEIQDAIEFLEECEEERK